MTFKRSLKREKHAPAMNVILHTLADENRRIILQAMIHGPIEVTIQHILERTYMSYHVIYHHLNVMEQSGLLNSYHSYRDGRERYYSVNLQAVEILAMWFDLLAKIIRRHRNKVL